MPLPLPRRILPALSLATLSLALPAAADAKRAPEMVYDLRVKATMTEEWDFSEYSTSECDDGLCIRDEKGAGTASIQLATPRPERVTVRGGKGGVAPYVDVGNEGGLPMRGEYIRNGSHVVDYSGPWQAANPDEVSPTEDCGRKPISTAVGFHFPERNKIHTTTLIDDVRECPSTPPHNLEWENGETPSLWDVVVPVQQSKFARTKQFTITGERTWNGIVTPFSRTDPKDMFVRGGSHTVTWKWEATFRKAKKAKRRKRG